MSGTENTLLTQKHILICANVEEMPDATPVLLREYDYLKQNFCGKVIQHTSIDVTINDHINTIIYLCGNIEEIFPSFLTKIYHNNIIHVINELSYNVEDDNQNEDKPKWSHIRMGKVPINIHNVGVYFRELFDSYDGTNYFAKMNEEHKFQALTESNKPTNAFRKGIYLSKVEKDDDKDQVKFNLLRCSTNLDGPTDNFRETDHHVVGTVDGICEHFFETKANLNHVLAQVYTNNVVTVDEKSSEKKATIRAHSDKTKDMPRNGLIAFTTFYNGYNNGEFDESFKQKDIKRSVNNMYDHVYKETSILTRLHFRLKDVVQNPLLVKDFSVTLYPNSVFVIPLSTNRLYTHEIKPSSLPIDKIPTRLGYVIRCSNTNGVFDVKDKCTYVQEDDTYIKLDEMTEDDAKELRTLYFKENATADIIKYGSVYFSMNNGDYMQPNL